MAPTGQSHQKVFGYLCRSRGCPPFPFENIRASTSLFHKN